MAKEILKYEEHFSPGMRVQVEIPLQEKKVFRDDAEIASLHQDLLQLRLSRTLLPLTAVLEIGTPLSIRTGKQGAGFRCRGIAVEYDGMSGLLVRLTGEILSSNDREYFRIDVYIPLTYRLHADGDDSETNREGPQEGFSWDHQGEQDSAARNSGPENPLPVAANLSGAGVRIHIPDRFDIDQLLELTLFLPPAYGGPTTLTGQVVYVTQVGSADNTGRIFDTALRFVGVDDLHRENLVKFIHHMQLEQLRRLREHSLQFPAPEPEQIGWRFLSFRKKVLLALGAVLSALVTAWLFLSLAGHYSARSKGEIEKTFEEQIRKLMGQP